MFNDLSITRLSLLLMLISIVQSVHGQVVGRRSPNWGQFVRPRLFANTMGFCGPDETIRAMAVSGECWNAGTNRWRYQSIVDLAMALSSDEETVYADDLMSDPVALAKKYAEALHVHQANLVDAIRYFLDDDVVLRISGDPRIVPFAGEHRGIEAVDRGFKLFFSILELPPDHDFAKHHRYIAQGTDVVIWGESHLHPKGQPWGRPPGGTPNHACSRMRFAKAGYVLEAGRRVSSTRTFEAVANPHWQQTRHRSAGTWLISCNNMEIDFGVTNEATGLGPLGTGLGRGFLLRLSRIVAAVSPLSDSRPSSSCHSSTPGIGSRYPILGNFWQVAGWH